MTKVLVISLGTISDTIYTIPLLYSLKRAEYDVHVLTSEKGYEVVNRNPIVKRVHLAPMEQWLNKMPYMGIFEDLNGAIEKVRKQNFDIVIDCQRSFRSLFFLMNSGAPRRLTSSDAKHFASLGGNETVNQPLGIHKVEENLNFARYLGVNTENLEFVLPEKNYNSKTKIDKFLYFTEERPILVLCPNYSETECTWSPKNWINFVSNIPATYNVIVVGTQNDNTLAVRLSHKNLVNLCGKVVFEDLRYLFSMADTIISDKLEYSLIAWANHSKRIVTLSTSISPANTAPYGFGCEVVNLIGGLPCQPCNSLTCKNGTYKCVHVPFVEDVLKVL